MILKKIFLKIFHTGRKILYGTISKEIPLMSSPLSACTTVDVYSFIHFANILISYLSIYTSMVDCLFGSTQGLGIIVVFMKYVQRIFSHMLFPPSDFSFFSDIKKGIYKMASFIKSIINCMNYPE
jgi:hypothetical protein